MPPLPGIDAETQEFLKALEVITTTTAKQDATLYLQSLPGAYLIRIHRFPKPKLTDPKALALSLIGLEYLGKCEMQVESGAPSGIGPEAIWNAPDDFLLQCQSTSIPPPECMNSVMQVSGASVQAIEFAKLLNWDAYMSSFDEFGTVDLVGIIYPWNPNDNFQYLLVNGKLQLIYVDDFGIIDIQQDSNYPAMAAHYPNLGIWPGYNSLVSMEQLSEGGQRFIFTYALVDGCHACQTEYSAVIAFDFDDTGQFLGTQLLYLE